MKSCHIVKVIFLFVLLLFLNSCATGSTSIQTPHPDVSTKDVKVSVIQGISFAEEENYTRIKIECSDPLETPFYKLLSDPLRIIIDVSNIDLKQIREPVKINNGTVGEVLTTQYDGKGRIEIGLVQMTNYNISMEEKNLVVDIERVKTIAEVKQVEKEEVAVKEKEAETPPPELKKEESPPVKPVETVAVPEKLKKAKEILNVSLDKKKDFVSFNIVADGRLGNYNAFKMDLPSRLVLDIWEVGIRYPKKSIKIQNSLIKKVRIGSHPEKIRFVFESLKTQLPPYQISQMDDRLTISFGIQPPEPKISLPEKTAAVIPTPKAYVRAGLTFKQLDNKSRIIVSLTEEAKFASSTISKNTIAVDIKNAFVPKNLRGRLDASAFESPVKYAELKNVKSGKTTDVRLLIKLREKAPFEVIQEGKMLFIDVANPKEIEAKVAIPPEPKKEEAPAETKKEESKKVEEEPRPELKKEEKALPPVEEKAAPQLQPIKKAEEGKKLAEVPPLIEKVYTGKKVSLDFKDAEIKNILRLIAEVSNFNIIAGDDVTGKITMRLVDVPWDQALDVILQARSLGMTKVGNVIRIAPLDSIKKEVQSELESRRAKERLEDLTTELILVNYATAKEILPQVKGILSERGDVKVDDRTNILIVKDIPRNIVSAKNLVKSLDTKTPQVLIEARIVEATLSFQRDLGIAWGFMANDNTDSKKVTSFGGGTASSSTLRGTTVTTRKIVDLPSATTGGIFEFLFTSENALKSLDIAISAYENKGDAKVISSPKIATLDNKEASIEQGLRIPYTKMTAEGTATEDFIEANLKLTVTPHVTNDGHIKMSIRVKKDEPDYAQKSTYGTPRIDKKESITEVLVKDNGVIVIAGIYTIKKSDSSAGVPVFSKIPLLGWLFKKDSKTEETKDLLIFISPKIFKDQV